MTTAGVAELKARLSEYLGRVRGGSEILVTERGRPIARIVPVEAPGDLAELEREGIVRVGPMQLPRELLDSEPPRMDGPGLTEALLEERGEGR